MLVSEDGVPYGSIDVSKLDELEPKTPEARAQVDRLKADVNAGREQLARDEERLAELSRRQNPQLRTADERSEVENAGRESSQRQQQESDRLAAERQKAEQQRQQSGTASNDEAELQRLQAEAEAAGVTVDKRWGADRLRQETEQAKASKSQQKKG